MTIAGELLFIDAEKARTSVRDAPWDSMRWKRRARLSLIGKTMSSSDSGREPLGRFQASTEVRRLNPHRPGDQVFGARWPAESPDHESDLRIRR
jgi:hypothetical protein